MGAREVIEESLADLTLEEFLGRGGQTVAFDPDVHPRDREGKFRRALAALKPGQRLKIKGGATIKRHDDGSFQWTRPNRGGHGGEHITARSVDAVSAHDAFGSGTAIVGSKDVHDHLAKQKATTGHRAAIAAMAAKAPMGQDPDLSRYPTALIYDLQRHPVTQDSTDSYLNAMIDREAAKRSRKKA